MFWEGTEIKYNNALHNTSYFNLRDAQKSNLKFFEYTFDLLSIKLAMGNTE